MEIQPARRGSRASSCSAVSAVGGLVPMSSTASPRTPTPPSNPKPKTSFAARMNLGWKLGRGKLPALETSGCGSRSVSECSTRAESESSDDSSESPASPMFAQLQDVRAVQMLAVGGAPVFIFDWDDTLLPTTAIRAIRSPNRPLQPLDPADMQDHAELVDKTLRAARAVGHVYIVTMSKNNWVLRSAEKYLPGLDMPNLIEELGITVYYAQDEEQSCPGAIAAEDWGALKRASMARCLQDWRLSNSDLTAPEPELNVISIGDSDAEQKALKTLLGERAIDRPLCKTVKLMDEPTLDQLSRQLQVLPSWFERMARANKNFDLNVDCPSMLAGRARALGL